MQGTQDAGNLAATPEATPGAEVTGRMGEHAHAALIRWGRPIAFGLTAVVAIIMVVMWVLRWGAMERAGVIGIDYDTFLAFARRWIDTGSMYLPSQLAGPFDPQPSPHIPDAMPSLYPPHAVLLFAPFLVLPSVLWWAIPLGVLGLAVRRWRPAPWTWPIVAAICALPETFSPVIVGGSTMWMTAAVAGGLLWGWPAVLITIKPSLGPFLLIGVRRRSWWVASGVLAVVALAFGSLWLDYATVLGHAQADLTYSLGSIPALLLPIVIWAGTRPSGEWRGSTRFTRWGSGRSGSD